MIMPHRLAQLAALPVWARRSKDRRPPSCSRLGKTAINYALLRPLLFRIDAEPAHHWTLAALKRAHALRLVRAAHVAPSPRRVMGLEFPNAVGLAVGLDKNGDYIAVFVVFGFGFF